MSHSRGIQLNVSEKIFLTQSQENSFFQKSKEDFLEHQNESLSTFEPV